MIKGIKSILFLSETCDVAQNLYIPHTFHPFSSELPLQVYHLAEIFCIILKFIAIN